MTMAVWASFRCVGPELPTQRQQKSWLPPLIRAQAGPQGTPTRQPAPPGALVVRRGLRRRVEGRCVSFPETGAPPMGIRKAQRHLNHQHLNTTVTIFAVGTVAQLGDQNVYGAICVGRLPVNLEANVREATCARLRPNRRGHFQRDAGDFLVVLHVDVLLWPESPGEGHARRENDNREENPALYH